MHSRLSGTSARLLGVVALSVVLVVAGCLGAVQSPAAATPADGSSDPPTVSVSASGSVSADPDLAVVHVAVVAVADTADAAREAVAGDATRMRTALRDLGVPDDAVHTAYFHLGQDFRGEDGPERWRAVHAFEVEVAPDRAGETIDAAVRNGADQVNGVSFTLTEETTRELRAEALAGAMADARSDADAVADAAGLSVTGVRSISIGGGGVPFFDRAVAEAGGGARTTIEPGPVTVSAQVSVVYTVE